MLLRERRRYARNYNINQVANDEKLDAKEREARRNRIDEMLLEIHERHQKDKEENKE